MIPSETPTHGGLVGPPQFLLPASLSNQAPVRTSFQLPSTVAVPEAPVLTANTLTSHISMSPISTSPLSSSPISTTPIPTPPIPPASISMTPISTTPISTAPIVSAPISSAPFPSSPASPVMILPTLISTPHISEPLAPTSTDANFPVWMSSMQDCSWDIPTADPEQTVRAQNSTNTAVTFPDNCSGSGIASNEPRHLSISEPVPSEDCDHEIAAKILTAPSPITELESILRLYYVTYSSAKRQESTAVPPGCPNTTRRQRNSISSAACAAKKIYGVSLMEHMTAHLSTELYCLAGQATMAGRADLSLAAYAAAISPKERKDRIASRVEAAAEAARVAKVAQKTEAEPFVSPASKAPFCIAIGGVSKSKRVRRRKAMNCATAHKTNHIRKGMFDEFLSETSRLIDLRNKMYEAIRPMYVDPNDLSLLGNTETREFFSAIFGISNCLQGSESSGVVFGYAAPAC